MNIDEKRAILSEHLGRYRAWNYQQLAERLGRFRSDSGFLGTVEGIAPDGTAYQMEFNVFWDDTPCGDVRVIGDLTTMPKDLSEKPVPVYSPDVTDDFIMRPNGSFVDDGL